MHMRTAASQLFHRGHYKSQRMTQAALASAILEGQGVRPHEPRCSHDVLRFHPRVRREMKLDVVTDPPTLLGGPGRSAFVPERCSCLRLESDGMPNDRLDAVPTEKRFRQRHIRQLTWSSLVVCQPHPAKVPSLRLQRFRVIQDYLRWGARARNSNV